MDRKLLIALIAVAIILLGLFVFYEITGRTVDDGTDKCGGPDQPPCPITGRTVDDQCGGEGQPACRSDKCGGPDQPPCPAT